MYLDFYTGKLATNCSCLLVPMFSGRIIVSIISMPDIESRLIIAEQGNGRINNTFMDYRKSPIMKRVKEQRPVIIRPHYHSTGQNFFCVSVSSQGEGDIKISCGSDSNNLTSMDKNPTDFNALVPRRIWSIVTIGVTVSFLVLCLFTVCLYMHVRGRAEKSTIESDGGDEITQTSRVFYSVRDSEHVSPNIYNEYEKLGMKSMHFYNDLSLTVDQTSISPYTNVPMDENTSDI
ncbi:uncharacterized protein LOC125677402 isoform X2 [Ostrea edulis]|nr:uncharacterized protein LOC125677402 isoform X2 [Ostrea edulis]XP_048771406.2 uncharacterized protein LOC125677402 isoform X2 [Ostrea edulis]